MAKKQKNGWKIILVVLIFLFLFAYLFSAIISLFIGTDEMSQGNVAVIPVNGVIMTGSGRDIFSSDVASSGQIVKDIEKAAKNPQIKAIILEINSPGGAPVATDEVATAIKRANKTSVAWIREMGASGGYWIASATEYIVANRMSITGSIGVYGSYLDVSGFIRDWNVSYERLVAGDYKDSGVPFRKLSDEERRLLQRKLDLLHQEFKDEVQRNRGFTNGEINAISEGEFYLGREALDLGLVDKLGGKKEAVDYIENKLNITADLAVYEHKSSLLDVLTGLINERSYFFGKGIGEGMKGNTVGMFS